jgi:hypothetical protein
MSNTEKLLEFWEKNIEQAFTRSLTRAPPLRIQGDRTRAEELPFQIRVHHRPELGATEITGRYTLGARQLITDEFMANVNLADNGFNLIAMAGDRAQRAVRRAIATRLLQDATDILAEGENMGQFLGMNVIVTPNLPENMAMLVHPRAFAGLLSDPRFVQTMQFQDRNT